MQSYLPEIKGLFKGVRKGRNVSEGYQRGWGLQFGDLREKILADPLYVEAQKLILQRSIMSELNRMNIFLILKYFLPRIEHGHIIEFGSYLGGNVIFMAYVADRIAPGTKVYALDSFEGMPSTDKNVDMHSRKDFDNVDLEELLLYVDKIGVKNLEFHKGYFKDSSEKVLHKAKKIALAHIDCDILSSVEYSYEAVKPFMVDGGYLVFDDATVSSCIGATEVVEDILIRRDGMNSEQIFPHFVFRAWKQE